MKKKKKERNEKAMIFSMDQWSRAYYESLARMVRRKETLFTILNDMFQGTMSFVSRPIPRLSRKAEWCEVTSQLGRCRIPNQRYCSGDCSSGTGLSSKCPPGFRVSHVWGYRATGCWCDTFQGRSIVCCDCTPASSSPYERSSADCGCMHLIS
jgi:hypothetical protein